MGYGRDLKFGMDSWVDVRTRFLNFYFGAEAYSYSIGEKLKRLKVNPGSCFIISWLLPKVVVRIVMLFRCVHASL